MYTSSSNLDSTTWTEICKGRLGLLKLIQWWYRGRELHEMKVFRVCRGCASTLHRTRSLPFIRDASKSCLFLPNIASDPDVMHSHAQSRITVWSPQWLAPRVGSPSSSLSPSLLQLHLFSLCWRTSIHTLLCDLRNHVAVTCLGRDKQLLRALQMNFFM